MRGFQTLFVNLFPSAVITTGDHKGQRSIFISRRDTALACRYYYHIHVTRKRYDDCLVELENEFFITSSVIVQRLTNKQALIKELVAKENAVSYLKKEYPQFSW